MQNIAIIAALSMALAGVPSLAGAAKPAYQPIDIGDEPMFEQVKLEVERRTAEVLIDPESARFKYPYMTVAERGPKHPNGWSTCAMVNSKNQMGGYSGYQIVFIRFVQSKTTFFNIVDDDMETRKFLCGDMPTRGVIENP